MISKGHGPTGTHDLNVAVRVLAASGPDPILKRQRFCANTQDPNGAQSCSEPQPPSGRRPEHLVDQQQRDHCLIVNLLKFHHQRASGLSRCLQETLSTTRLHPAACPFHPQGKSLKSLKTRS